MKGNQDQVLKDHIDKEFDKNDFSHNGFLPPKNLHIYVNEVFSMGGINIYVGRDEAFNTWKKCEPNATGVTKIGLYHTLKEIYWAHSRAEQEKKAVEQKQISQARSSPVVKRTEKVETYTPVPTTNYYAPQPQQGYYPPVGPQQCVETIEETSRKKRGVGFEINFLGFDFGTGFNRGTKTKVEKTKRWF